MYSSILSLALLVASGAAQQAGTGTPEVHPALPMQDCTKAGGCKNVSTSVTLDASYRYLHDVNGSGQCYTGDAGSGGSFNQTLCPDEATCGKNCALDGVDYSTYGIKADGGSLTLNMFANGKASSPRVYLMANETTYQQFQMLNREFSFDVDVSKAPCGVNGALYLTEMDPMGSITPNNPAGAKYGTGYCDAQCTKGKFVLGQPSLNGTEGACCAEMDIWEANSAANALTPHPCKNPGQNACTGADCKSSCDTSGCDFNPYRLGARNFFGPGGTLDTKKPFTVITQFVTADGTNNGALVGINRLYKQDGQVKANAQVNVPGINAGNATITDDFCKAEAQAFGEADSFQFSQMGGLKSMGEALGRGMTLSLSIWDDKKTNMQWLDGVQSSKSSQQGNNKRRGLSYVRARQGNGTVPATNGTAPSTNGTAPAAGNPGDLRGPCNPNGPAESDIPQDAAVVFSNIKTGEIGSTF